MSKFIKKKESFRYGFLDKVPVPEPNEGILLYRDGNGENGSIFIDAITKPFSADIRRGKFNVKVTFDLSEKQDSQLFKIAMSEGNFYFYVKIKISYTLKNAREYYFKDDAESEGVVRNDIKGIMDEQDGKWKLHEINELEKTLQREFEKLQQTYYCLQFNEIFVEVKPDEEAEKLIKSDKEKSIEIYTAGNKADIEVAKNFHKGRVMESSYTLQMKQLDRMEQLARTFGEVAPVVEEYLDGKIDGRELYKYIDNKKEKDINILARAREEDWLTDQSFNRKLEEIMGHEKFAQVEPERKIEEKNKFQIEKKEEPALEDGDFV
ncbi:MAG: hypothetical protein J1F02_06320 [Lachnospiraceae bacterium]|nr:hypothetical protein [Lachnospiraceae bacterium]